MNSYDERDHSPVDLREVCRAEVLRTCCLPHHKRGEELWVLNGPFWSRAVVERRLPGNVYAARFTDMPRGSNYVIICAQNYGGVAE